MIRMSVSAEFMAAFEEAKLILSHSVPDVAGEIGSAKCDFGRRSPRGLAARWRSLRVASRVARHARCVRLALDAGSRSRRSVREGRELGRFEPPALLPCAQLTSRPSQVRRVVDEEIQKAVETSSRKSPQAIIPGPPQNGELRPAIDPATRQTSGFATTFPIPSHEGSRALAGFHRRRRGRERETAFVIFTKSRSPSGAGPSQRRPMSASGYWAAAMESRCRSVPLLANPVFQF